MKCGDKRKSMLHARNPQDLNKLISRDKACILLYTSPVLFLSLYQASKTITDSQSCRDQTQSPACRLELGSAFRQSETMPIAGQRPLLLPSYPYLLNVFVTARCISGQIPLIVCKIRRNT